MVVQAGYALVVAGLIALVKPMQFLLLPDRTRGLVCIALGMIVAIIGWNLPASTTHLAQAETAHDLFSPAYQFNEVHRTTVHAPAAKVFAAVKEVTADEIFLFGR